MIFNIAVVHARIKLVVVFVFDNITACRRIPFALFGHIDIFGQRLDQRRICELGGCVCQCRNKISIQMHAFIEHKQYGFVQSCTSELNIIFYSSVLWSLFGVPTSRTFSFLHRPQTCYLWVFRSCSTMFHLLLAFDDLNTHDCDRP